MFLQKIGRPDYRDERVEGADTHGLHNRPEKHHDDEQCARSHLFRGQNRKYFQK
jgi:hypothetical protein